ncbi:hypothetical protein NDU88_000559 [Pleurodeles waltl]|uniref:WAP domain-containing protein n=2 Tax=Pleurodeles waltl TaxID=8319 RepID=A0AAV7P2V8_PLEWA|nr:hypothetical protein NDU88_000559 [Pleurodeles waltl]
MKKPGMCLEEFFAKHPKALELFKTKMTETSESSEETSVYKAHQRRAPTETKGWAKPQKKDDHFPHGKPKRWHLLDFSKLPSCSLDKDCDGMWKCCHTMCGKRCMKPMFEDRRLMEEEERGFDKDDTEGKGTYLGGAKRPKVKLEEQEPVPKEEHAVQKQPPNEEYDGQKPSPKEQNTTQTPSPKEGYAVEKPSPNQQYAVQAPAPEEGHAVEESSPNQD